MRLVPSSVFRAREVVHGPCCRARKEGGSWTPSKAWQRKQGASNIRVQNYCVFSYFGDPTDLLIFLIMVTFCILLITKNAKVIPTAEKPVLKSSSLIRHISLPSCHLSFIASHPSYFCRWGVSSKITYCTESGVLNLCKGKECVMAKIIYCMASPLRVSLLFEF